MTPPSTIHLLVVEDSPLVTRILRHLLRAESEIDAHFVDSRAKATDHFEQYGTKIFAAMVDLNLPDAPDGEVVDDFLARGIPVIVLTGSFDENRRERLLSKGIVDYVAKEGKYSYNYAIRLVLRLRRNENIRVMIADDSQTARHFVRDLLERHRYQVIEATDGRDAIKTLLAYPDTRILLVDYNMPSLDGFQLTRLLRDKFEKTDLIILGLSGEGSNSLSAKFIKNGANDFLKKPFNHEEFYCRMMHSVETLELTERLRQASRTDQVTGLATYAWYREASEQLIAQHADSSGSLSVALLRIDDFDQISAENGRTVADEILEKFGQTLGEALRRFVVGRQGGSTFAATFAGLDAGRCQTLLDSLISRINAIQISADDMRIQIGMSGGVTDRSGSLNERLQAAEALMIEARNEGGNFILASASSAG